jgi:tetratricopeptide (TPR) repeat protein
MKLFPFALAVAALAATDVETSVNHQDGKALQAMAAKAKTPLEQALIYSRWAQVAMELGDKKGSAAAAQTGIPLAEKAVSEAPKSSEAHRLLGTLCGQVIPANPLAGISRGRCALDEVDRSIELDPKSSMAYLSRGIGNYYLPPMFGGGVEKAIVDLRKAIALDAKNAEAHMWLGIVLRKANKNAEARAALQQALKLNPQRKWAAEQLAKTPEH